MSSSRGSPARRRLLGLLLLLALGAWLRWGLPGWSAHLIGAGLQGLFNRPASVGSVSFHLLPLSVEIRDVWVQGQTPSSPPFIELPRAVAVPTLGPLWGRRIELSELVIEGLRVRIHAFLAGGDDIPRTGGGTGGGLELSVRRLIIRDGEFSLDHRRVPLELELPDFRGRLAAPPRGFLEGTISFGPGRLRFNDGPPLPFGTDIELTVEGRRLKVSKGRLFTRDIDLAYTGEMSLQDPPSGLFQLAGPVDLAELDHYVMRTPFGIAGKAQFEGFLTVVGSRLRLEGEVQGTGGMFDGVAVSSYQSKVEWNETGAHFSDLEVETLGGSGVLDLALPPKQAPRRLSGHFDGLDAEQALEWLFDLRPSGLGASASGRFDIHWPRGKFRELTGEVDSDLSPRPGGRTPLQGRFEWSADAGHQRIDLAELETATTTARFDGQIALDRTTDLALSVTSSDLRASDELIRKLRYAVGVDDVALVGVSGSGRFDGRWLGSLSAPIYRGRFIGPDFGYLGVDWGAVDWIGEIDGAVLLTESLKATREGAWLDLAGSMETGFWGEEDHLAMRAEFDRWPAEDFVEAFGWDIEFTGPLQGRAELRGRRSRLVGNAHVRSPEGSYLGVPFSDLDARLNLHGGVTEVTALEAAVGKGRLAVRGSLTDLGSYDGTLTLDAVDAGLLLGTEGEAPGWGGRLSGEITLQGPLDRPRLVASLRSRRLFYGDEGVGALEARLLGRGDGDIVVDMALTSPRLSFEARGRVAATAPYQAELQLAASETSLDPFVRVFQPALPGSLALIASGDAALRGPLLRPSELEGAIRVHGLELLLPELQLRMPEPVAITLESGRVNLGRISLEGAGSKLVVAGNADLGEEKLDLTVDGSADLSALLGAFSRKLRGSGSARILMSIGGSPDDPSVEGTLELQEAAVRYRGFPHGIDALRGTISLRNRAAQFENLRGRFGGGEVEARGRASFGASGVESYDVDLEGRGLALRYPEGLRSVIETRLRLFGDDQARWITGEIDVIQANWRERYDLATELLAATPDPSERAGLGDDTRLNLRIRAPGTLRIDNNLATLQAQADVTLQGTVSKPVLLGRAEMQRGRVYFQGHTYVIRTGRLEFANAQRIDPIFDLEAETRVRSYRVTLKLNGTLERVYPTLTSEPPLSAVQILNLLAGGDERTIESLTQVRAEQNLLAAAGAATLATGAISEGIGLEREAERLFGLDRFSIDPSLLRTSARNPSARMTLGKRVSPDLTFLYSFDLRGNEERIISIEYNVSDRISLLFTQSDPGGLGIDIRLLRSR